MVNAPVRLTKILVLATCLSCSASVLAGEHDMRGMQELSHELKSQSLNLNDTALIEGAQNRAKERAEREQAWTSDTLRKRQDQVAELIRNGSLPIGKNSSEPVSDANPFPNRAVVEGTATYVLVSWSMPRQELLEIMERLQGKNASVVFRGIPASTTMLKALEQMNSLTIQSKSDVQVLIDPFVFKRTSTVVVPTIIKEEDQKLIAKVTGLSTTDYLDQAISEGKSGDLGVQGPTLEIIEPDFMTLVQHRIENLDFEDMKSKALSRFWEKKKLELLPVADIYKIRYIDPTVIIPTNITAPSGDIVATAGPINPLRIRKFTQRVIFIDATSEWQVEFAKKQVESYINKQRVTVITTTVDKVDGWSTFGKTSDYIGVRIGLLEEGLRKRFQIQKIPSVLTANDSKFIVEEFSQESLIGAQP